MALEADEPLDGHERLSPVVWTQDPGNEDWALAEYHDTPIQDRLDREEAARVAAEAARQAHLAAVAAMNAVEWVHLSSGGRVVPAVVGGFMNPRGNPPCLYAAGWRRCGEIPAVADGYERLQSVRWEQDPIDDEMAVAVVVDALVQDRLDAEAIAAEARRVADEYAALHANDPVLMPHGIEVPVIVLISQASGTPAWGYVADVNGSLVPYIDHASPRNPAAAHANKTAALADRQKARTELAGSPSIQRRLEIVERILGIRS
jgi:hypothetical protein